MIKPWEIWLARVKFEDTSTVKERPVVITSSGNVYVIGLKVTSKPPRNEWGEYQLVEWKFAGLHHPSTVRISKQICLRHSDLIHYIGDLHTLDIINIQNILSKH